MKFKIKKEIILESLQKILGPTTSKQNFPILSSVFLQAEEGKLRFTTTDLDTTIINTCQAEVIEKGNVAIPMRRFLSIIKELPSGEITIELTKGNLLIKCEKVEFKITTLDATEFPKIEESKKASLIKINPETLEEMMHEYNIKNIRSLIEFNDEELQAIINIIKLFSLSWKNICHCWWLLY